MKLILPISFIVIVGALLFFVTNPLYGEVKQLKAEVSAYNLALDNSTELQKTRDSLVDTYKNIKKEDKERLEHFLPSAIGNIELILEIEKIANLNGMPIKNIKFESLKSKPLDSTKDAAMLDSAVVVEADPADYLPYGIFPMEFVIEGRYDSFLPFLNELEHNLRLVDVKSINFAVPSPTAVSTPGNIINPNIYSYTLKVETYWLK